MLESGLLSRSRAVIGIDHDRLFKELLTTFFVEFLELFFPRLASLVDRDSISFLDKEVFTSLFDGKEYEADIVARVRFAGEEAFFLIHVETQSTPQPEFGRRLFRYFTAFLEKYNLPIYPIVVFSYDRPLRSEPSLYRLSFPDGEVLRFSYRVVQLNRLPWRRFLRQANPVASALMAKMRIAPKDRVRVKLECLRLLVTLKLDPARMRLVSGFIDTYLRLDEREESRFVATIQGTELAPAEEEKVVEIVTSWMEKGLLQGHAQGLLEGREEGQVEGARQGRVVGEREVLLRLGTRRFGPPSPEQRERLSRADLPHLELLTDRLLDVESWQALFDGLG